MAKTSSIELNNGNEMPAIGFGTWQLADGNEAGESVKTAIEAGYRLIDTAKIYGNEESVGKAVRSSHVARKELFITTKLWTSDFGYDSALRAFDESLGRLSLDYVDLYLLHWPNGSSRKDAWQALREIHKHGRAKSVGVSNYMVEHLWEVLDSGLVPAVNQIEFQPLIYEKQKPVLDLCAQEGIAVEAYSPLARGKALDNRVIAEIAGNHGKTTAQVMLRWAIQHGTIPIPKSANPERIQANINVFDFELTKAEMDRIDGLSSGKSSLPFFIRAKR